MLTLRPIVLAVLLRRSDFVGHPGVCWIEERYRQHGLDLLGLSSVFTVCPGVLLV